MKLIYLLTKGLKISTFFLLSILIIPSLLMTLIPISLFLSVLYYYNKIKYDREMLILENSGLNYLQIAKPAIILSLILTLICYSISLYFLPLSYGKLKSKLNSLKESYTTSLLYPKSFNPIAKDVTLYFEKKNRSGSLEGIVIFDYREAKPVIFFAKVGKIKVNHSSLVVRLLDGSRQYNNHEANLEFMNFSDLIINIPTQKAQEKASPDIQGKYLYELFSPEGEESLLRISKLRAEGHQRLVWPLFNIALVMIVLANLIPSPYNRRVTYKPILYSIIWAILILLINFTLSNLSIRKVWIDYLVYLNLFMSIIISTYKLIDLETFNFKNGRKLLF